MSHEMEDMMKKIIILGREDRAGYFEITALFRLDVPVAQHPLRADPSATSLYAYASAADIESLRTGAVMEEIVNISCLSGMNLASIGQELVNRFNDRQSELTASTKFKFFGSSWDGSTWTVGGA